jgi:uncharacterized membrane protein YdcZ (DUF606 family)
MIEIFLQSVVAAFVVFALLIWTASGFIQWFPSRAKWFAWMGGCIAVATVAQALLWSFY